MLKLKVSLLAELDLQSAAKYYNRRQVGLGRKFEKAVNATFKKIQLMPQSASISHNDIRYKVMNDFPFIITYRYDDKIVHITRIFNTYLDSEKL